MSDTPKGSDLAEIAKPEVRQRMSQFEGRRHRDTIAVVPPPASKAAPATNNNANADDDEASQLAAISMTDNSRATTAHATTSSSSTSKSTTMSAARTSPSPPRYEASRKQKGGDDDDDEESEDDDDDEEEEEAEEGTHAVRVATGAEGAIANIAGALGLGSGAGGGGKKKGGKRSKFAKAMLLKPQHENRPKYQQHSISADTNSWGDSGTGNDAAQPLTVGTTIDMGGIDDGVDPTERTNRRKPKNWVQNLFRPFHNLFMLLPVQALMFILLLVDLSFLIYEFAEDDNDNKWGTSLTMATSSTFLLELLVHMAYLGSDFFFFDKKWQMAEVAVVSMSFIVELTVFLLPKDSDFASRIRYLRIVRAFRILILWKTRFRHFRTSLRQLVSADRRRYQKNGFDLDLTYVESNIIAMSWPSESMESIYRNHIDNVSRFMDVTHPDSYWIYNLCSERQYDETKFRNRVTRYRLDDHNPGELWSMFSCAQDVTLFLGKDPSNIVAIHCKGGKGRTGTMTCSYLLYSRRQPDADSAMTHFGKMRTSDDAKSFQGVESPSQARYLRYFDRMLKTIDEKKIMQQGIPTRRVRITKLVLRNVPAAFVAKGLDRLWFAVITAPSSDRVVEYISNPTVTFSADVPLKGKHKQRHYESAAAIATSPSEADPSPESPLSPASTVTNGSMAASTRKAREQSIMGGNGTSSSSNRNRSQSNVNGDGEGGCQPFGGNMVAYINGDDEHPVDCETATKYYKTFVGAKGTAASPSSSTLEPAAVTDGANVVSQGNNTSFTNSGPRVDVAFSTTGVPSVAGDTIIKFFYNVDAPNPLHPPLQFWFHPYFEKKRMCLSKLELDGPHKEGLGKQKKWSNAIAIEMELEDA